MKTAIPLLAALVLTAAVSCACSSQAAPTSIPTLSPDIPTLSPDIPTPSPDISTPPPDIPTPSPDFPTLRPDATSRVGQTDVFCPTQDDQAWQHYNDAVELEGQGRLEEAREHYEQAIALDPAYCDAMDNLGRLLRGQGHLDEAIYWYGESIKVLPDNIVAHQNLAVAYRLQGRIDEAIEEYQLLVLLDADNPEGYYGLAQSFLDLGQPHDAIAAGKKAEQLYAQSSSPLLTDARHLLGVAYIELEDCKKVLEYFELVYSEMQSNPGVNYFLGVCLLIESQDRELARRYLEKAQELGVDIPPEVLLELDK